LLHILLTDRVRNEIQVTFVAAGDEYCTHQHTSEQSSRFSQIHAVALVKGALEYTPPAP
jgi:hypothetical protein